MPASCLPVDQETPAVYMGHEVLQSMTFAVAGVTVQCSRLLETLESTNTHKHVATDSVYVQKMFFFQATENLIIA